MQTCSLYFLPGAASIGHTGGRHEYPSGQEGPNAERFPHLLVPAWLVLHKEPGEGPASSGGLPHGQPCFISSKLHHWLVWIHVNWNSCSCHVLICSRATDITGIQKPRSRLQRRHLWNMPPYGGGNGGILGEKSGIHEGVGPGKWQPDASIIQRMKIPVISIILDHLSVLPETLHLFDQSLFKIMNGVFSNLSVHSDCFIPCSIVTTWQGW